MGETIQIGRVTIEVVPQKHKYLTKHFSKFLTGLMESGDSITGENFATFLDERAYEALCVLIPRFADEMSEHEFRGYGSFGALEQEKARQAAEQAKEAAREAMLIKIGEGDEEGNDLSPEAEAALRAEVDAIQIPEDPYDERDDNSPSFPDIANAFEVAVRVNRFDALKILGKVVDPQLLRRQVSRMVTEAVDSTTSLSLPSPSGEPASTSSGPTSPTWTASEGGPTPASMLSETPTDVVATGS